MRTEIGLFNFQLHILQVTCIEGTVQRTERQYVIEVD